MDTTEKEQKAQMKITMLGTGEAVVTKCYNTCFIIDDAGRYFMVDGGGGNTILRQLGHAVYDPAQIREIFVTHKHVDHLLGIIWVIRIICQGMAKGRCEGEVTIYGHEAVIALLRDMAEKLLQKEQTKFLDSRVHLVTVCDGETRKINGRKVTFFDIRSTKAQQFGFCMELDGGEKLTCCGDEPYNPCERAYVENSKWLLHEAFCLYSQRETYQPYKKHHSTVKDACELAQQCGVKNLILYHTEDDNLEDRKQLYGEEGRRYFQGNLYIPDDLETIVLS